MFCHQFLTRIALPEFHICPPIHSFIYIHISLDKMACVLYVFSLVDYFQVVVQIACIAGRGRRGCTCASSSASSVRFWTSSMTGDEGQVTFIAPNHLLLSMCNRCFIHFASEWLKVLKLISTTIVRVRCTFWGWKHPFWLLFWNLFVQFMNCVL